MTVTGKPAEEQAGVLPKLIEGIDDPSFRRFYQFLWGWGPLLAVYGFYVFLLLLPRELFDVQWPRDVLTYFPKFWYETNNFKDKYRLVDVRFYFFVCLLVYVCACVVSVVVAVKCYRAGRRVPLHAAARQAMRPFRHLLVPALFTMAWTTVMPMPVGWSSNGYRGNPVENPLVVPLFLFPAAALLVLISAASALWLGRERARREQERSKPPKPIISVSLDDLDNS